MDCTERSSKILEIIKERVREAEGLRDEVKKLIEGKSSSSKNSPHHKDAIKLASIGSPELRASISQLQDTELSKEMTEVLFARIEKWLDGVLRTEDVNVDFEHPNYGCLRHIFLTENAAGQRHTYQFLKNTKL